MTTEVLTSAPKRYHPALVALHWLTFVLIFGVAFLAMGNEERRGAIPSISIFGLQPIGLHMLIGIGILVLLVVRLMVRWRTQRPAWASTGNAFLNKVGEWTHAALYFFTFAMTITGIILAAQTNRLAQAFGITGSGGTGPGFGGPPPGGRFPEGGEGFREGGFRFGLGNLHGMIWAVLILLIVLHVGAALYHQFILKDNLLGRMWFGKKDE